MRSLLRATLLLWPLCTACEGVPITAPARIGGGYAEEFWPIPDYVPELRTVLWVNAQQLIVRAEGEVVLRHSSTSGDAYLIVPYSVDGEDFVSLHERFVEAEGRSAAVPIERPFEDVAIPVGLFELTDLNRQSRFSILVRNQERSTGVTTYQNIAVEFLTATTFR